MVWDVDDREDPVIAFDLIITSCLIERITKRPGQPFVFHAFNRIAMSVAKLES